MRVLHNTLVNITNEHMGSQSVLFEGRAEHGPWRALVIDLFMHVGVMEKPS